MFHIQADNIDELYFETLWALEVDNLEEQTRGGRVLSIPEPVIWELTNPRNRVLINPVRDANPFFHVMEFIWMMSGEGKIEWITQFSKNYGKYAQDYQGYGYRWRGYWFDQISRVIDELQRNPDTRRAVLQMWDAPDLINTGQLEVPCNIAITFRHVRGKLDMTVLNRSNDIIWGALGANIVHMTMLHELIAFGAGIPLGTYRVFSTNAHVYMDLPRREEMFKYKETDLFVEQCRPILREGEKWGDFLEDCECFVAYESARSSYKTEWIRDVACNIYRSFFHRDLNDGLDIECPAWSRACEFWLERRKK